MALPIFEKLPINYFYGLLCTAYGQETELPETRGSIPI